MLSDFSTDEAKSLKVALNDTVSTPVGKLVVTPTLYYADKDFGKAVTISKRNREEIALAYSNSLQVALASKTATIINPDIAGRIHTACRRCSEYVDCRVQRRRDKR